MGNNPLGESQEHLLYVMGIQGEHGMLRSLFFFGTGSDYSPFALGLTKMATLFHPENFVRDMKPARFGAMPCRPICGLPLQRIHWACIFHCGIRLAFYGRQSNPLEIAYVTRPWPIWVRKVRRLARVKDIILKTGLRFVDRRGIAGRARFLKIGLTLLETCAY